MLIWNFGEKNQYELSEEKENNYILQKKLLQKKKLYELSEEKKTICSKKFASEKTNYYILQKILLQKKNYILQKKFASEKKTIRAFGRKKITICFRKKITKLFFFLNSAPKFSSKNTGF